MKKEYLLLAQSMELGKAATYNLLQITEHHKIDFFV